MKNAKKKRCEFCRRWYLPDYRTWKQQYCCSSEDCQRQRKLNTHREWLFIHPDYYEGRRSKINLWAKNFPFYWRNYRSTHGKYAREERRRVHRKLDESKNGAKQDLSGHFTVGGFQNTFENLTKIVAKQDSMLRRTNSLLQSFFGKFSSQNKTI